MNKREAKEEGLVCVPGNIYHEFYNGSSNKESLKEHIKNVRKKYGVRIIMITESSGSGFNRYVIHDTFAEPILLDYLLIEKAEEEKKKLENERIKLEAEYREKLNTLESKEIAFFTKLQVAAANIETRKMLLKKK